MAIKDSEKRYRNIVDNAIVGIYQSNLKGDILYVNKSLVKIFGFESPQEMMSNPVLRFYKNSKDREILIENLKKSGKVDYSEIEVLTKTGETKVILLSAVLEGDTLSGIIMDITDRKKMEVQLNETQRTLMTLMSNLPGMVYRCHNDRDWTVEFLSDGCFALTGYHPSDFMHNNKISYGKLIHPDDQDMVWNEVQAAINKHEQFKLIYRINTANGEEKWVLEYGRGIFSEDGNLLALEGFITDITDRKRAEEEKEYIHAQLIQAHKMEAVGRLAGGIAHDFNNLLTAIAGYSDHIIMGLCKNDPIYHDIEQIKKAGDRAASLTKQLLAFSRRQVLQTKVLDINILVSGMGNLLRRIIGEDINLVTDLTPNISPVKADPYQIEQVIMNLVVNARDAMPNGGDLTIRTEDVAIEKEYAKATTDIRKGRFACISVVDTGIGLDEETIEHIFEPFFSTKESGKGTGLGLSVAYGIIRQHDGWIDVYSKPSNGSIFKVYLPVSLIKEEDNKRKAPELPKVHGNGERILLVEDETLVREFTAKILRENGYIIFESSNIKEAMDIFEKEKGDLHILFADIVLPDGTGTQLAEKLLNRKSGLKIVFTSGYTDKRSQLPLVREKGFLFMQKPYSLNDLLQIIREAVTR